MYRKKLTEFSVETTSGKKFNLDLDVIETNTFFLHLSIGESKDIINTDVIDYTLSEEDSENILEVLKNYYPFIKSIVANFGHTDLITYSGDSAIWEKWFRCVLYTSGNQVQRYNFGLTLDNNGIGKFYYNVKNVT